MSELSEGIKEVVDRVDKLVVTLRQGAQDALGLVEDLERLANLRKGKDETESRDKD